MVGLSPPFGGPGLSGPWRVLSGLWGQAWRLALTMLGVSVLTFGLTWLAPGDPAEILLRDRYEAPTAQKLAQVRAEMGLDDALALQYLRWLGRAARLDFGLSYVSGRPVSQELGPRALATAELALTAFGLVVALSLAGGLLGGLFHGRLIDRLGRLAAILAMSAPNYWLGMLLIWLFAVEAGWLPVMGRGGPEHLILPALTLALAVAAMQARVLRASVIETKSRDYVRLAMAKGLGRWQTFTRHVVKNSLLPALTMWGLCLGHLLGGSVIVESVFSWPGLGQLAAQAILARDMPVLQAAVMLMALFYVVANLGVDALYRLVDPRLRQAAPAGESCPEPQP